MFGVTIDTEFLVSIKSHKITVATSSGAMHHYDTIATEMSCVDHMILKVRNCHVKINVGQTL